MIGDSVLNGNNTTDQKETIPELFEARLLGIKKQVEVLNASAASWGIGNQLGYIRKADLVFQQLCIQKKLVACSGKK